MRSVAESASSVPEVAHPQLEFVIDSVGRRVDCCDVGPVKLECGSAVRDAGSWQHKTNYCGYYWAATVRRHVWFESLYERSALMRLDRDRRVVGIAAQPVWIHWATKPATKHAPDYFVRFDSGHAALST